MYPGPSNVETADKRLADAMRRAPRLQPRQSRQPTHTQRRRRERIARDICRGRDTVAQTQRQALNRPPRQTLPHDTVSEPKVTDPCMLPAGRRRPVEFLVPASQHEHPSAARRPATRGTPVREARFFRSRCHIERDRHCSTIDRIPVAPGTEEADAPPATLRSPRIAPSAARTASTAITAARGESCRV